MPRDPYEVLGVDRAATADEIKSAFRRLAREHHPDVNPGNPQAEEKFKEIGEAYGILSDPEKKARFDRFGVTDDQAPGPGGDFFGGGGFQAGGIGDLFDMFLGGGMGGGRVRTGRDGDDVRVDVTLTYLDVLKGTDRTVKYRKEAKCGGCAGNGTEGGKPPKTCGTCKGAGMVSAVKNTFLGQVRTQSPCPTCAGEGTIIDDPCKVCKGRKTVVESVEKAITVPAGVEDGTSMRVAGAGGDGVGMGRDGDLYVVLSVEEDSRFERDGMDLFTSLPLNYPQAVLGDSVKVAGLEGELDVEVRPGTQPGTRVVLKGQGLPPLHGGRRGDLVVETTVRVPSKPSPEEERLIRELAALQGGTVPHEDKGGFLGGLFGKKK